MYKDFGDCPIHLPFNESCFGDDRGSWAKYLELTIWNSNRSGCAKKGNYKIMRLLQWNLDFIESQFYW